MHIYSFRVENYLTITKNRFNSVGAMQYTDLSHIPEQIYSLLGFIVLGCWYYWSYSKHRSHSCSIDPSILPSANNISKREHMVYGSWLFTRISYHSGPSDVLIEKMKIFDCILNDSCTLKYVVAIFAHGRHRVFHIFALWSRAICDSVTHKLMLNFDGKNRYTIKIYERQLCDCSAVWKWSSVRI